MTGSEEDDLITLIDAIPSDGDWWKQDTQETFHQADRKLLQAGLSRDEIADWKLLLKWARGKIEPIPKISSDEIEMWRRIREMNLRCIIYAVTGWPYEYYDPTEHLTPPPPSEDNND